MAYLPPYSPDFNPIEPAFSKFKTLLRTGARRTTDALWELCGRACDLITPADCRGYFRHCGYRYA
ncbi:transposase [Alienimonas sp. DA493]|uniref:transposase n=1 Tax=Alienimonas sp. DA493 TaxID=3373605 RepID=UPI0037543874